MALASARNSRRSMRPPRTSSAIRWMTCGTRSPLLLKNAMLFSPMLAVSCCVWAFNPTFGQARSNAQGISDAVIDRGMNVSRGNRIADAQKHEAAIVLAARKDVAARNQSFIIHRPAIDGKRLQRMIELIIGHGT